MQRSIKYSRMTNGPEPETAKTLFLEIMKQAVELQSEKETGVEAFEREKKHRNFTIIVANAAMNARKANIVNVGEVNIHNSTDKYFKLLPYYEQLCG